MPHAHAPAVALHTKALIDRFCLESDFAKRLGQVQIEEVMP